MVLFFSLSFSLCNYTILTAVPGRETKYGMEIGREMGRLKRAGVRLAIRFLERRAVVYSLLAIASGLDSTG